MQNPTPGAQASKGSFTVDCGTNGNGKFSPDNPVAQPGIKNGAEHVHDFVGNLAITANSSNADLDASGHHVQERRQVLLLLAGRAHRQDRPLRSRQPSAPSPRRPRW